MQALRELVEKRYKLAYDESKDLSHLMLNLIYGTGMVIEKEHCFIKEVIYDFELYDALCTVFPNVKIHYAAIFIILPPPPEEELTWFEVEVFDLYGNSLRSIGL